MITSAEDIKIEPYTLPIQLWFKSLDHYVIKPFFQREHVWSTVQESSLIESIILGYPIPTIYSYLELASGKELIIDGQQRLTAIRRFINNAFPLKNLKILTKYSDYKFNELPFQEQNKILNYKITITSLKGITDKQTIFEIFHRYNTGGVNLNNQEIRNAIYCGKYNDFIIYSCSPSDGIASVTSLPCVFSDTSTPSMYMDSLVPSEVMVTVV